MSVYTCHYSSTTVYWLLETKFKFKSPLQRNHILIESDSVADLSVLHGFVEFFPAAFWTLQ